MNRGPATDPKGRLWLAETMWKLGCVQFGEFTLGRTVRNSPVYINPKLLLSRPAALRRLAQLLHDELRTAMAMRHPQVQPFDAIAGVPIGGLHLATALSLQTDAPLLYVRPQHDDRPHDPPHIEGVYTPGQTVLIVDDLAAGGGSLVETAEALRHAGLHVRDAVVLIDREQGARRRLEAMGLRFHPVLSLEVLLTYLYEAQHVSREDYQRSVAYLRREGELRSLLD